MTAIAGIVAFDGCPNLSVQCAAMLEAQRLYGDGTPAVWSNDGIALGKRPHRVTDRVANDGVVDTAPIVLVADVRLDNRDELVAALGLATIASASDSDSDIVHRSIARWGFDAVARLVGEFAIAWWDPNERRLSLARDFLGQRPLHFHRASGSVMFSSMAKGLHALPAIARAPNPAAVARALANLPVAGSESFFAGIERVEPGHVMTVDRHGVRQRRYWTPTTTGTLSATAARDALRTVLDTAVAARLRDCDGRVASHLSGGLDSSAVTATAARLLAPDGGEVMAYTSIPCAAPDPNAADDIPDERRLAGETAARYPNVRHVLVPARAEPLLRQLDRNVLLYERPVPNVCNQFWIDAINDSARDSGLAIVLNGMMGNLTFSHSGPNALPNLFARREWRQLAGLARAFHARGRNWHGLVREAMFPRLRLRRRRTASDTGPLLNATAAAPLTGDLTAFHHASADAVGVRLATLTRVDVGNFAKGALAGWGIEMRDPTADRRLVDLTMSLPEEMFVAGGVSRAFARDALADRLPATVTQERRRGYQAADWNTALLAERAVIAAAVRDMARDPIVAAMIDTPRLIELVERWPDEWPDNATAWRYRMRVLPALSAAHFLHAASGRVAA